MKTRIGWAVVVLVAVAAAWAVAGEDGAFGGKTGAEIREEAMKALGDDSIREAMKRADSETLLGLAILATGKASAEAATAAVKADPVNEVVLLVARAGATASDDEMAAVLNHVQNDQSSMAEWQGVADWLRKANLLKGTAGEFTARDPSNAFAYYLQAAELARRGSILEAVATLKQGTGCPKVEPYDVKISRSIGKAFDALRLSGISKLAVVDRVNKVTPPVWGVVWELPRQIKEKVELLPEAERDGVADTLLAMAGQLGTLAANNRRAEIGRRIALVSAFGIKQAIAKKEESPREKAYAATIAVIEKPVEAAEQSKPSAEIMALNKALQSVFQEGEMSEMPGDLPADVKASVEQVFKERQAAAERLLALMARNADILIEKPLAEGVLPSGSALVNERPELVAAAQEFVEKAQETHDVVEQTVPAYRSQQNLKKIGTAILMYSLDFSGKLPPDLETLAKDGYVSDKNAITSPFSGKPYVYLGGKARAGGKGQPPAVLVYDEKALTSGGYMTVLPDGSVQVMSGEEFKEKAKKAKE